MEKQKFLQKFTIFELILIAMMSAVTIAFKSIVRILVSLITGPLGIPGGALAGGLYMLWMPLTLAIINKRGTALLMTIVQTIVVFITAAPGSHGIWTFVTYLTPALAVELAMLLGSKKGYNVLHFILACALANIFGTIGSNLLFFRLSAIILCFTLTAAALSGSIGGTLGYLVYKRVLKTGLIEKINISVSKRLKRKKEKCPQESPADLDNSKEDAQ